MNHLKNLLKGSKRNGGDDDDPDTIRVCKLQFTSIQLSRTSKYTTTIYQYVVVTVKVEVDIIIY